MKTKTTLHKFNEEIMQEIMQDVSKLLSYLVR